MAATATTPQTPSSCELVNLPVNCCNYLDMSSKSKPAGEGEGNETACGQTKEYQSTKRAATSPTLETHDARGMTNKITPAKDGINATNNSIQAGSEERLNTPQKEGDSKPLSVAQIDESDTTKPSAIPVKALVSEIASLNTDMLIKYVLLAGKATAAHLDTCATHCFLSKQMSKQLSKRGYNPIRSHVEYRVEQGNPLCTTSTVHVLPLAMAHQTGGIAAWTSVLFVVADCGADVIICHPILKLGGIIDYDPPEDYIADLRAMAEHQPTEEEMQRRTQHILQLGSKYHYEAPDSKNTENGFEQFNDFEGSLNQDPCKIFRTELKRGITKNTPVALTEAEPYGKNPPLPNLVIEALTLLKNLAGENPCIYTPGQLSEVQQKLRDKRPEWSKCLTMQHLEETSDAETEQFINQMMDKPRWQKSIFQTAMHLNTTCDFKEFEIPQKPGRDMWNPPQPKLYRNPTTAKITEEWLDTLLTNNKCRESNATHPAPVTIVERPPRDPRVCINYINRNHRTEVPVFPMPDVWDFLDDAAGFEHYCSFDMAKMFTQFRIKEEHRHLAAFITPRGVFEPNVVMFGLAGAPQHAVREVGGGMAKDPRTNGIKFTEWAINENLKGVSPPYDICPITKIVKGSKLRPFIDDVFIKSNHKQGMIKLVELFFEFCEDHHLILSRKKAVIMKKNLRTLGFVVSKEGKHLDPTRIVSLLEMPLPRSKETLHSMLSSYTFIRMFIPNFASIAAPLYEATRGIIWKGPHSGKSKGTNMLDPDFTWSEEMKRAYDQLRNALLEAPILTTPDWDLPLFLSVDASMRGEGWVLWQLISTSDGAKVAVAILYGSRKYSDTERKWETTRQEATAIRSALEDVEQYVFGRHFYLFSDHLNLRFMHNSTNRAVLRMRDFLAQFNMTVVHCPGTWNNADAISRLETTQLPVELATNMNSLTEGRLQPDGNTVISTGTDTNTDSPREDDKLIIPTSTKSTDQIDASTLRTIAQLQPCCPYQTTCLLCNTENIYDDQTDIDVEQVTSLKTNTSTDFNSVWEGEGLEPIIQQILKTAGCDLSLNEGDSEYIIESAFQWNKRNYSYPSEMDNPLPEDAEDKEEMLWCGHIDRTSVTTKSCRTTVERDKKTSSSPPITSNKTMVGIHEHAIKTNTDTSTQTLPADFRIATIKFPMMDDFRAIHNDQSGHHGLEFSYRKLLKRCGSKWANERGEATKIKEQLKQFIDGCPTCQKLRGLRERIKCKHSFIISRPFLETSYDFIIFKRPDRKGNRYLLVAIDNFTKLVEMKPTPNRDAETVAQFLLELASRYGHCARLRSDREAAFMGQVISQLNAARGTETTPCIAYRPQANSICERQNAIVTFHLTALVMGCNLGSKDKIAWSDLIPTVFSIVNNTPKNPLGISPLSLVYGIFANYDRPLLNSIAANAVGTTSNPVDYVDTLIHWQSRLLEITEEIQNQHFEKMEKRFNFGKTPRVFHEGEFVLQRKNSTGISGKPSGRWIGPFLVMGRREHDPSHPVLDLMNLTDLTIKEAAADDCRKFNTSWFEEENMIPELTKIAAADLDEYVVEKILAHRPEGEHRTKPLSKYFFLVKWEDFEEPTWEPYSGISKLEPLDTYSDEHPGLKIPKSSSA